MNDFDTYAIADADCQNEKIRFGRKRMRLIRRTIKRCWLDRETIMQPRVFCQNIGSCGSTYFAQLLRDNGIEKVFHEKAPDLNEIGVEHYETPLSRNRLVRMLRYTRHNAFVESNNRLFSLSQELAVAFPNAKFVHLYRDPTDSIRSNMSKPDIDTYARTNVRLTGKLGGPVDGTPFEKFCHYWRNSNQRIFDDLAAVCALTGGTVVRMSFRDLIAGNLDEFENFTGLELANRVRPPVNRRAIRIEGKYPAYPDWTLDEKATFDRICRPLFEQLNSTKIDSWSPMFEQPESSPVVS